MPRFTIIEVPYHMGLEDVAVGRGPALWLGAGADRLLSTSGEPAQVIHIRKLDSTAADIDGVVDVNRQVRYAVREALGQGSLPVVLAGNCNSCLGTRAGLKPGDTGIVWLDAHGDFNIPESSASGALEGMSLAAAVGDCHEGLRERIGLQQPVREENVILLGTRDWDEAERERLLESQVHVLPYDRLGDAEDILAVVAGRVDKIYLHIDIDFLHAAESPGVNCRAPGGVGLEEAETLLAKIAALAPPSAVAMTNYNPDLDRYNRTLECGLRLLRALTRS